MIESLQKGSKLAGQNTCRCRLEEISRALLATNFQFQLDFVTIAKNFDLDFHIG